MSFGSVFVDPAGNQAPLASAGHRHPFGRVEINAVDKFFPHSEFPSKIARTRVIRQCSLFYSD